MLFGRICHLGFIAAGLVLCVAKTGDVRAADAPGIASTTTSVRPVAFVPVAEPTYTIPGRPVLIAMEPQAPVPAGVAVCPDRSPEVAINGMAVHATSCVLVRPMPGSATGTAWEPEAVGWSSEAIGSIDRKGRVSGPGLRPDESGFWAVLLNVPPDVDRPVVTINGRGVPIIWLDPPPPLTGAGRPVRPVASATAWRELGDRLRPLWLDPIHRWRVRLLLDRVTSQELWGDSQPTSSGHPSIEAWAARQEDCWRLAIEEVRQVDPVLSSDLLHALTAIVAVPGDVVVPAWPLDDVATQRLLRALLDPGETRSRKAEYARAWLAAAPDAVAWVIDDADAAGPTIGVAELSGRRTNVALAFPQSSQPVSRSMLAHESVTLRLPLPESDGIGEIVNNAVEVRAEQWRGRVAVGTAHAAIKPPGFITGPFVRELTHTAWLTGASPAATGSAATTAMIQPGGEPGDWQVFLQCAAPIEAGSVDQVRVWFGSFNDASAVATIVRDGGSTLRVRERATEALNVQISERDRGWNAMFTIPRTAIEQSVLRIGFDRTVGTERASWPRPMLPGQAEPGRIAIDLSTWGSLSED